MANGGDRHVLIAGGKVRVNLHYHGETLQLNFSQATGNFLKPWKKIGKPFVQKKVKNWSSVSGRVAAWASEFGNDSGLIDKLGELFAEVS